MSAKKVTLLIDESLVPWLEIAPGLTGARSMTDYINRAIERDRDRATPEAKAAYEAFLKARPASAE